MGGRRAANVNKGMATQRAIINKAVELFAVRGYDQTSFQKIANDCGVSQATALFHFKSKLGLMAAVADACMDDFHAAGKSATRSHGDANSRVTRYLVGCANWIIIKPAESQILLLVHYLATFENSFADIHARFQSEIRDRILELMGNETVSQSTQIRRARALRDFLTGMTVSILAGRNEPLTPAEIQETIASAVHAILRGGHD